MITGHLVHRHGIQTSSGLQCLNLGITPSAGRCTCWRVCVCVYVYARWGTALCAGACNDSVRFLVRDIIPKLYICFNDFG